MDTPNTSSSHLVNNSVLYPHLCLCDGVCIALKYLNFAYIFGLIANGLVIVLVAFNKRLHTPTFVVLATVAIPDFIVLATGILKETVYLDGCPERLLGNVLLGITYLLSWCTSAYHIVFVSVIRYMMLIHPLRTQVWLTKTSILCISFAIWVFVPIIPGILVAITIYEGLSIKFYHIYIGIAFYVLPVCVMSSLHIVKYRKIKTALLRSSKGLRNMSRVITVVVVIFVVLPLPYIMSIITPPSFRSFFPSYVVDIIVVHSIMLQSSMNPVIYTFMSSSFRNCLLKKCRLVDSYRTSVRSMFQQHKLESFSVDRRMSADNINNSYDGEHAYVSTSVTAGAECGVSV